MLRYEYFEFSISTFAFLYVGIENWSKNNSFRYSTTDFFYWMKYLHSPYSCKFLEMTLIPTSGLHIFLNTPLISIGEVTSFLKNYILCGKAIATEIRYKRICKTRSKIFSLPFSSVLFNFAKRELIEFIYGYVRSKLCKVKLDYFYKISKLYFQAIW